jgi:hypothetical protein
MTASWSAENIGTGSGNYVLGNYHGQELLKYAADTSAMQAPADYTTFEVTDGSVVVPTDSEVCPAGKYRLLGYQSGDSLEAAEGAVTNLTAPVYTDITTDKYVIVINEKCPNAPETSPQCSDDIDNSDSEDSLIDSLDPACHSDKNVNNPESYTPELDNESNPNPTQCSDGISNDNDVLIDSLDPGCQSGENGTWNPSDNDETDPVVEQGGGTTSGSRPRGTGKVLGASTEICDAVDSYMRLGYKGNKPEEVKKVQGFLNGFLTLTPMLPIDGQYGPKTANAVGKFQEKQAENILKPWGFKKGTKIFYKTSLAEAKRLMCPDQFGTLPIPTDLKPWNI